MEGLLGAKNDAKPCPSHAPNDFTQIIRGANSTFLDWRLL
jgi:hypothetical protein